MWKIKSLARRLCAFATGVTVVTANNPAGRANRFYSQFLYVGLVDPPLLLVCIAKTSRNYGDDDRSGAFRRQRSCPKHKKTSPTPSPGRWRIGSRPSTGGKGRMVARSFPRSRLVRVFEAGPHRGLASCDNGGRVTAFENQRAKWPRLCPRRLFTP